MVCKNVVAVGIVFILTGQTELIADPSTDWELQHLHAPADALLQAERRGRITIYDSVSVTDVDKALDDQFDRIDSMMFVRTVYPMPDGDFYADDDCD